MLSLRLTLNNALYTDRGILGHCALKWTKFPTLLLLICPSISRRWNIWITLGLYSLTWLPGAVVRAAGLQLQGPELHALCHAGRHVLAPLYRVVSAQLEYVDVVDIVDMVDMVDISSV